MLILKLTPESSDEHCGLPIFLSKVTDENNESTLSMMCGTPLWHGTWGPGWLSPFEIQLIKILSNAITAGSHSCSLAVCSPFMSMLFHHYITLKYEVWRCFFFFFCNHQQIVEPESRWNSQGGRAKDCCASLQNHWHFFSYCNTL